MVNGEFIIIIIIHMKYVGIIALSSLSEDSLIADQFWMNRIKWYELNDVSVVVVDIIIKLWISKVFTYAIVCVCSVKWMTNTRNRYQNENDSTFSSIIYGNFSCIKSSILSPNKNHSIRIHWLNQQNNHDHRTQTSNIGMDLC